MTVTDGLILLGLILGGSLTVILISTIIYHAYHHIGDEIAIWKMYRGKK